MADIFFSPLNQFRFVPNAVQIGTRFNTNDIDEVLFANQRLDWQEKKCFAQPVQSIDGLKIIFNAVGFVNEPSLTMYSQVHLIAKGSGIVKSARISLANFRVDDRFYYYINDRDFFVGINDGIYALVLELYHRNAINPMEFDKVYYYSDTLDVKAKHKDTLWVQYSNYYSKLGIPFEQLPSITSDMGMRIYGSMVDIGYTTERTVFDDQDYNPTQLKATANRLFTFYFGGDRNQIPNYIVDKLNHIFTCSTIFIDNVEYVPNSDSTFEKEGDFSVTLFGAQITLSKKNTLDSYSFIPDESMVYNLIDFSKLTYPYALDSVILRNRSNIVVNPSVSQVPTIIQNMAQRTAYIVGLNNSLPSSVIGRFSMSGDSLIFTKEDSDNVFGSNTPSVYQKCFKIHSRFSGLSASDVISCNIGNFLFRSELLEQSNINAFYSSSLGSQFVLSAPTSGDYYCLVFVNENISTVEINGKEFVNIESLGNTNYGYASDLILSLDIQTTHTFFAQTLNIWALGNQVNGVVVSPIDLAFRFANDYSFSNISTIGQLGIRNFNVSNSGISNSNLDSLYNGFYQASINNNIYQNMDNIITSNNIGQVTSSSLIARNYLTQVRNINITL